MKNMYDPRSLRGIFARGHARYRGPANAPRPGNMTNIQRAAKRRLAKMYDKRKYR